MPSVEYQEVARRIAAARAEAQDLAAKEFGTEAKNLVRELGIDRFSWTQYTPYFNDEDVCVFDVYSGYPEINGVDEINVGDADPPLQRSWPEPAYATLEDRQHFSEDQIRAYYEQIKAARGPFGVIEDFLSVWDKDDMLFMFGDHVKVTATETSVDTQSTDHD